MSGGTLESISSENSSKKFNTALHQDSMKKRFGNSHVQTTPLIFLQCTPYMIVFFPI